MAYDALGNYTGYDDSSYQDFLAQQEEEDRKRREEQRKQEEEAAGQVVHKQEIETRADGSKTISTTADLPPAPPAPTGVNQSAPTGPVTVPVQPQPSAGAGRGFVNPQPVQPVNPQGNQSQGFDQAAYNASIAQQESGGNPNIGYHDIKTGTAYGPYGITALAWKDARASDPSLPQDITRATPEQMVQAQNQFTDNNARYLKNYGVEVTPSTLSAAHFLGARGLRDYLRDGTISPQTAANNGGEDKVREIVQARLGGQPAPASGAVTSPVAPPDITTTNTLSPGEQVVPPEQPVTQPQSPYSLSTGQTGLGLQAPSAPAPRSDQAHVDQYQSIQDKPMDLLKFGTDPSTPKFLADRARNRAADLLTQDKEMAKAKEEISTMTETDLAKKLREKTTGGSYFKLFMYGLLGMENSGRAEAEKLGLGGKDQAVMGIDGKPYLITIGANGTPREGYNATTGAKLSADELVAVAAGATTAKNVHQGGTILTDPSGQVKGSWVLETRAGGIPTYKQVGTGRVATPEESALLSKANMLPKTGQSMGYDKEGNVISHTINADQTVTWKNETTGETLKNAPQGYHTGKDQRGMLGDQAFKQSMTADEAENRKQQAAGLPPMYTPAQIAQRANAKRDAIVGLAQPGQASTAVTPAQTSQVQPGPIAPESPAATGIIPQAPAVTAAVQPSQQPQTKGTPLPAELETQAQAIANGGVKMPTGMGANNRRNQAIQNRVYEINPKYDPTIFENRQKTETAFSSGKQGDVVRSMNVSIDHLDSLQQASNELKNGPTPLFNDIANRYAKATGQPQPTNFDALKTLVGSEVAKAIQGGATALGDREEIRNEINNTRSPAQLAGVIDKYQHLLAGQMSGLKTQYESGGGRRWDSKINPRTAEIMTNIDKTKAANAPAGGLPAPYADKTKEQRYQEWLKKRNMGQ